MVDWIIVDDRCLVTFSDVELHSVGERSVVWCGANWLLDHVNRTEYKC